MALKSGFSAPLQKMVQIRYHKSAGTKMHKCVVIVKLVFISPKIYVYDTYNENIYVHNKILKKKI